MFLMKKQQDKKIVVVWPAVSAAFSSEPGITAGFVCAYLL